MATLHDRMLRDERLKRRWAILRNQTEMLAALKAVYEVNDLSDTTCDQALELGSRVALEILLSCQAIWDESVKPGEEPVNV